MEESINHTAAFLISEEKVNRKVLRALCWVPVTCFTNESVGVRDLSYYQQFIIDQMLGAGGVRPAN